MPLLLCLMQLSRAVEDLWDESLVSFPFTCLSPSLSQSFPSILPSFLPSLLPCFALYCILLYQCLFVFIVLIHLLIILYLQFQLHFLKLVFSTDFIIIILFLSLFLSLFNIFPSFNLLSPFSPPPSSLSFLSPSRHLQSFLLSFTALPSLPHPFPPHTPHTLLPPYQFFHSSFPSPPFLSPVPIFLV